MADDSEVIGMKRSVISEILAEEDDPPRAMVTPYLRKHGEAQRKPPELVKNAADKPEAGGGPESFDPESSDYKAYGWAGNKTLPSLVIILKDGSEYSVNYCDLASAYPGGSMFLPSAPGCKGNVIRLLVAGADGVFLVVIEGRRLRRVWELIMGHKTPWIHELPAAVDFGGVAEPVVWSVTFQALRAAASGGR